VEDVLNQADVKYYENLPVKKMSLGMKQKLLIAIYIMSNTSVLLLDESFNGLDIDAASDFCQLLGFLKAQGKTIIISSHSIHYLSRVCTRIDFLKEGKIVQTTTDMSDLEADYRRLFKKETLPTGVAYA